MIELHLKRFISPLYSCRVFPSSSLCQHGFLPARVIGASMELRWPRQRGSLTRGRYRCFSMLNRKDDESEGFTLSDGGRVGVEENRPPFDINLAIVLAGFAFEAYRTPPETTGKREVDAAGCETLYLSESFVREIYDGQLVVRLKKGLELPVMDLWGTSDPYVVFELDGQIVKSNIKWGTKEPSWDEEFRIHTSNPPKKLLQVAAWDANIIAPHKRMGNAAISLENICDGNCHDFLVELEGMGGGGKLQIEIKYQSYEKIEAEKKWWMLPFISDLLQNSKVEFALALAVGSESISASQFAEKTFAMLKQIKIETPWMENSFSKILSNEVKTSADNYNNSEHREASSLDTKSQAHSGQVDIDVNSDSNYWIYVTKVINEMVVKRFGLPTSLDLKWEGLEMMNRARESSQNIAELEYAKLGLSVPKDEKEIAKDTKPTLQNSSQETEITTKNILQRVNSVLGTLVTVTLTLSKLEDQSSTQETKSDTKNLSILDDIKSKEMKDLFNTTESAMEAWAMLATFVGQSSFVKSEFEKICFLDNDFTDTQVAMWRDCARKRLVIAFRGTELSRWKDMKTDLMFVPTGLNPERSGGNFKDEVQVHSGFLDAYDSVRIRILSIIKQAIVSNDEGVTPKEPRWRIYVTGHSLGGALATLMALELSSSVLSKEGLIFVSMYNFGSPRVGNNHFAQVYNQKVKDSWRVVNHRDIVPTVPRLMGYVHVAQPVYLSTVDLRDPLANINDDVIGENTPDALINEFINGERELINKILDTEINLFSSIRDGSALMQHMEDFYYVTLLECVRSNYKITSPVTAHDAS